MKLQLPKRLIILNGAYALDGGSTHLSVADETGDEHWIKLVQHMFPGLSAFSEDIPGRLYFDDELIPVSSPEEAEIVELLRNADVKVKNDQEPSTDEKIHLSPNALIFGEDIKSMLAGTPEQNLRAMLQNVVGYVGSAEYIRFATKTEQMMRG